MKSTIILYRPQNSGNIGAVARVMANFGLQKLVLINPQCDHLSFEAKQRAKHAGKILQQAKVSDKTILQKYSTIIATTAIIGRDTNIARASLTPEQLKQQLKHAKGTTAFLFGNEADGLPQSILQQADITVTIATTKKYQTMNLSHSVAVILYELSSLQTNRISEAIPPATQKDKQLILSHLNKSLKRMNFPTTYKEETQKKVWRKIFGKAFLTKREAMAVMGFFKRIK